MPGLDLRAEVETVVGYSDTTLRKVRMTLQKRANKLTGLDVRGILEGGKPFVAILQPEPGKSRRLRANRSMPASCSSSSASTPTPSAAS